MSLEAIKKVSEAEAEAEKRLKDAAAEARRLVADAERLGNERREEVRAEAESKVKSLLADAELKAAAYSGETIERMSGECAKLREAAGKRMDEAVSLIVGRIVNA